MEAIRAHSVGDPEVLSLESLPDPSPGPGQALVRVAAAGVNFIDTYHRRGQYPSPRPIPLGLEGAGTVEAVGEDAAISVGARVAWSGVPGSYASHVVVPADRLVEVPANVDLETAAAVMLQGMTAHYLATSTYRLTSSDTCLVHAAAGGVGLLLCQIADHIGARVIGTCSTEEKAARARSAGADDVIQYTRANFVAETLRLTGGVGVNVVYDSVGKSTFSGSLDCLAARGMLVLFGQASGPVEPFDPQLLSQKGSLYLTRPTLVSYTADRAELLARAGDLFTWIQDGRLTVRVDRRLALADAPEAHALLESRATSGKLLLIPSAPPQQ